ncbi:MAG: hypothetical protein AB7D57_11420 [Desulfovibrionaceae bacterium]
MDLQVMRIERLERVADPWGQGTAVWKDRVAKAEYRRVVGGLAWPFDARPGAVVVLAELAGLEPGMEIHGVEVAAEGVRDDPGALLRLASDWQVRLGCLGWVTGLDAPEMALVHAYNEERRRLRQPVLSCAMPPAVNGTRGFRGYDRLLERRTRGQKTLTFGEKSLVAREYKVRQRADLERRLEVFPLLAAFLWALAEIDLNTPAGGTVHRAPARRTGVGGY